MKPAHIQGMSTFTESQHPREAAGKFRAKAKAGAGVALDVYEPPAEPSSDAQPGLFQAADGTMVYGYDSGQDWNGFAQPWLTELSVQRLAQITAGHREASEDAAVVYRATDGTWMVDEGPGFDEAVYRQFPLRQSMSPDGEDVYMLSGWDFTPVEPWGEAERAAFIDEGAAHILLAARMYTPDLHAQQLEQAPFEWDTGAKDEVRSHFETFTEDNETAIRAAQSFCPDYAQPGAVARAFWRQNTHRGGGFDSDERLGEVGQRLAESANGMVGYDLCVNDKGLLDVE